MNDLLNNSAVPRLLTKGIDSGKVALRSATAEELDIVRQGVQALLHKYESLEREHHTTKRLLQRAIEIYGQDFIERIFGEQ